MSSYFDRIIGKNGTLYIHRNFRNDTFEQALLKGEKIMGEFYRLTTVPSSKFARVYKLIVGFNGVDKVVYFKRYLCRSVWDFLKGFIRDGRAERSFKASEMLCENGFGVPAIIAIGKSGEGFCDTTNFLVTLEIENAKQIHQFTSKSPANLRSKRELIRAFGQTIGRMHAKGIFHGDLRLGNILSKQDKGRWRLFFLDNERTRKFHNLPERLRLKNLVQINMFQSETVSNTDRMRFFREYWAQNTETEIDKTDLIKAVLVKTQRRLAKQKYIRK